MDAIPLASALALLASLAAVATGCGGGTGNGDGGATTDASDVVGTDAPADAAVSSDAATADVAPATRTGEVRVISGPSGGASIAGANFYDVGGIVYRNVGGLLQATQCTTAASGACMFYSCTAANMHAARSAGSLTVGSNGSTYTLPAGTNMEISYYAGNPTTGLTWRENESVDYAATGSTDVPAFSGATPCPSTTQLMSPADNATVPRSADLTVTWAAFSTGSAVVEIRSSSDPLQYALCTFPGTAGTGVIPSATLTAFTDSSASLNLTSINRTTARAGDWAVDLVAEVNSIGAGRSLTLQ